MKTTLNSQVRAGLKPTPYCKLYRRTAVRLYHCLLLLLLPLAGMAQDLTVCANQGFMLTSKADAQSISGGVTYTWYVSKDGGAASSITDSNTPSLTVVDGKEAGTYAYVRMVASDACSDVPSNTFTVAVRPAFTAGAISSGSTTIQVNTGSTVTVTSTTPASGGDGDISYLWVRSGTSAATLTGSASSYALGSDAPSPGAGTYTYTRYAKDATCKTAWEASSGSYILRIVTCPYTGADLFVDATHPCQLRTAGAKNWEAYIRDERDETIYRITQFSDNTWWMAEDMTLATGMMIDCGGERFYSMNLSTTCPADWSVPTQAQLKNRYPSDPRSDNYGGPIAAGYAVERGSCYYNCNGRMDTLVEESPTNGAAVYTVTQPCGTDYYYWKLPMTHCNGGRIRCLRTL